MTRLFDAAETEPVHWSQERIRAVVRVKDEYVPFDVPLITQVTDTLWIGGCIHGVMLDGFDLVVSLYTTERYVFSETTVHLEHKLRDIAQIPDMGDLYAVVQLINEARQMGKRILVHCQAGLNRSGFVTALSLITFDRLSPQDAIRHLRSERHEVVLCNETFERWLLEACLMEWESV